MNHIMRLRFLPLQQAGLIAGTFPNCLNGAVHRDTDRHTVNKLEQPCLSPFPSPFPMTRLLEVSKALHCACVSS